MRKKLILQGFSSLKKWEEISDFHAFVDDLNRLFLQSGNFVILYHQYGDINRLRATEGNSEKLLAILNEHMGYIISIYRRDHNGDRREMEISFQGNCLIPGIESPGIRIGISCEDSCNQLETLESFNSLLMGYPEFILGFGRESDIPKGHFESKSVRPFRINRFPSSPHMTYFFHRDYLQALSESGKLRDINKVRHEVLDDNWIKVQTYEKPGDWEKPEGMAQIREVAEELNAAFDF